MKSSSKSLAIPVGDHSFPLAAGTGAAKRETSRTKPLPGFCSSDEVRSLASRHEVEIVASLRNIAGRYGRVLEVSLLPEPVKEGSPVSTFLIDFEMTLEAVAAARAMQCPLAGFSTVMVSIPRPNRADGVRHRR